MDKNNSIDLADVWGIIKGIPALRYLKDPVHTVSQLYEKYPDGDERGTVVLVIEKNAFYRWSFSKKEWIAVGGSSSIPAEGGNISVENEFGNSKSSAISQDAFTKYAKNVIAGSIDITDGLGVLDSLYAETETGINKSGMYVLLQNGVPAYHLILSGGSQWTSQLLIGDREVRLRNYDRLSWKEWKSLDPEIVELDLKNHAETNGLHIEVTTENPDNLTNSGVYAVKSGNDAYYLIVDTSYDKQLSGAVNQMRIKDAVSMRKGTRSLGDAPSWSEWKEASNVVNELSDSTTKAPSVGLLNSHAKNYIPHIKSISENELDEADEPGLYRVEGAAHTSGLKAEYFVLSSVAVVAPPPGYAFHTHRQYRFTWGGIHSRGKNPTLGNVWSEWQDYNLPIETDVESKDGSVIASPWLVEQKIDRRIKSELSDSENEVPSLKLLKEVSESVDGKIEEVVIGTVDGAVLNTLGTSVTGAASQDLVTKQIARIDGDLVQLGTNTQNWNADAGLIYPNTRIYEGKIYRVVAGKTTTASDVPRTSGVWELVGGGDDGGVVGIFGDNSVAYQNPAPGETVYVCDQAAAADGILRAFRFNKPLTSNQTFYVIIAEPVFDANGNVTGAKTLSNTTVVVKAGTDDISEYNIPIKYGQYIGVRITNGTRPYVTTGGVGRFWIGTGEGVNQINSTFFEQNINFQVEVLYAESLKALALSANQQANASASNTQDWNVDKGLTYPATRVYMGNVWRVVSGKITTSTDIPGASSDVWELVGGSNSDEITVTCGNNTLDYSDALTTGWSYVRNDIMPFDGNLVAINLHTPATNAQYFYAIVANPVKNASGEVTGLKVERQMLIRLVAGKSRCLPNTGTDTSFKAGQYIGIYTTNHMLDNCAAGGEAEFYSMQGSNPSSTMTLNFLKDINFQLELSFGGSTVDTLIGTGRSVVAIENNIVVLKSKTASLENAVKGFNEKTLVLFGDSLTASNNWQQHMQALCGWKQITVLAKDGYTWSNFPETVYKPAATYADPHNAVMWNQYNRFVEMITAGTLAIPDYIHIMAGANDTFWGKPVGAVDYITQDIATIVDKDVATVTTICESVIFIIGLLSKNYPTVKIILSTPPIQPRINNPDYHKRMTDGVMQAGRFCGVPVIDAFGQCRINNINKAQYLNSDGVHLTTSGAKLVGETIAAGFFNFIK